jgi:cell division protein FtsN
MSHDYGKNKKKPVKRNQKSSQRASLPGWVFFFSGVAFTLFAQLLIKLALTDAPVATTANQPNTVVTTEPAVRKPAINFYNQLKTMEVKVPLENTSKPVINPVTGKQSSTAATSTSPGKTAATEPAKTSFRQALQVGSYKTQEDAESQRAKLSLLGIKSTVEVKPNPAGGNYYRVITSTYTSAIELDKARNALKAQGMASITVKR